MKNNIAIRKLGSVFSNAGPIVAVIILSVVLSFASSTFLTVDNWMNILRQTAVNSMIAIGMLLILLTAGIDLSVGSACALCSCIMGAVMRDLGIQNAFLLILICLGSGLVCGYINGALYTKLRLPHPFVATLGTMQIFRGLAQIISKATPITGFPEGVTALGFRSIGAVGFPVCFLAVIVVFVLFSILLNKTPLGKKIYAVGGNEEAARVSGINVQRVKMFVYVITGLLAGFAALILTGRVSTALPTTGEEYAMDAIASCVIGGASFNGGKGTVGGTFVGALFIQIIRNGLNLLGAQSDLQKVVIGAVVIIAVVIDVRRSVATEKAKRIAQAKAQMAA
ncbi:MAG: ABC transporter permease [Intestinibacillus sp.]